MKWSCFICIENFCKNYYWNYLCEKNVILGDLGFIFRKEDVVGSSVGGFVGDVVKVRCSCIGNIFYK